MLSMDIHADTRRIADLLASIRRGGSVTLDALSGAIGRDIRTCRYLFYSAAKIAEREAGAVFATERRKGYRRLTADEIVQIGQTARAKIRGTARRGARSIAAGVAGANDLSPEMHRRILAEQSALGLLAHLARDKHLPKIPETETRPLSIADTAKAFLRAIGATTDTH